jgi:probable rRNA maturation factor
MNDRPRGRRLAPPPEKTSPEINLDVRAQSRRWHELGKLPSLRALLNEALEAGIAVAPCKPMPGAELSLLLTDDKRIRIVNRDWRGFDKATNVLSFPAAPPEKIASSPIIGDVVLAFETVAREAEAEEKSLGEHLSHLVIHGLLHLLGEDHETEEQAQRMEALETAALARLGIADPYADSDPEPMQPRPAAKNSETQTAP